MRGKDRKPRAAGNVITPWTDDRVEKLICYWIAGWSAEDIADALGETTRNAVIGKAFRLGLKHPHPHDRYRHTQGARAASANVVRPARDPTHPTPAPAPISEKEKRHD